ncbi:ankyrin repeat domain-containing protein 50 [Echria macrotheca]|uniref:Ankyrin repeat domain-containing protein 50 n=1 Tax=Echria macrotheca TaxID=438768 RepID=A0AAJ0BKK0_9PEZI|nr:ankyrin repeat domain-containing protein 50 [Echria macrotheca]
MDPLSVIASTIAIIQAVSKAYQAIQHLRGLPKTFDQVYKSLPLVQDTLKQALNELPRVDQDARKAIEPVLGECEKKAEALLKIFREVSAGSNDANDRSALDIYRAIVLRLGRAHEVETLMQDILRDLKVLAVNRLFRVQPQLHEAKLDEAITRLSPEVYHETRRIDILQALYTSPYLDRKNRNPDRVSGTCEWFTNHDLFRQWRDSNSSSMLWVSADPGCGKSVLAKYLVESVLPTTRSRTTCYFFFKDDFSDQRSTKSALCSILHQLFMQREILFSDEIVKRFEAHKLHLTHSSDELWEVLILASQEQGAGEIVCIIDAFDECEDQDIFSRALCRFYGTRNNFNLKFLVTSRPQGVIRRGFQPLDKPELPVVHLSGENEAEMEKIEGEIDIYIRARVQDIQVVLKLDYAEKQLLLEGLLRMKHRTYLWVYLTLDLIQQDVNINKARIRDAISHIPPTVDDAYEKILNRSTNPEDAKKLLHIITAATRPLALEEMSIALALQQNHRSYQDLDLQSPERFREHVRDLCGLFITIIGSRIYLLHQTAREFLVMRGSPPQRPLSKIRNSQVTWKYSLQPEESHRTLFQICLWYLFFTDFETWPLEEKEKVPQYLLKHAFLEYSARNWALHSRESGIQNDKITKSLLALCDVKSKRFFTWFTIYSETALCYVPPNCSKLMVASYFGLEHLVQLLLKEKDVMVNFTDSKYGRSALSWASENGFDGTVKLLLKGPRIRFRDLTSPSVRKVEVDAKDSAGRTPLSYAASKGHASIMKQLIKAGAVVHSADNYGMTPMLYGIILGHDAVVTRLMKEASADYIRNFRNEFFLSFVSKGGKDVKVVVEWLLDSGVDIETADEEGRTALGLAACNGHQDTVRLLVDKGANIEAVDKVGRTALGLAAGSGHESIVQLLLEKGADVEAADAKGITPLDVASERGYEGVVRLLQLHGAK